MKLKILSAAAVILCCISCVDADYQLGGNLIPTDQTYTIYSEESPLTEIQMSVPDSLSGYSQTRITLGAIRDEHYGLTTRGCALTLVPMYDTLKFGTNPKVKRFHFAVGKDTLDVIYDHNKNMLQNVKVYPLTKPLSTYTSRDLNTKIEHSDELISKSMPVYNGSDSLSFDFKQSFAEKFLDIKQEDLESMSKYLKKFPGIYLETDEPTGLGGRINCFDLQLGYDSSYYTLTGNFAALTIETKYDNWDKRRDTTFFFYYSPADFFKIDSLLTNSSTGNFPQYCFNTTSQQTSSKAGPATDKVLIEGGGGLKPRIPAKSLKAVAEQIISSKGADPKNVVINKATIVMPFEFPEDYKEMDHFPYYLSPTCRIITDTSATYIGLTDSSSSDENQGDIDRSNLQFAPDITYHLQELLKIKDTDTEKMKRIENGSYDIWFLIVANEVTAKGTENTSGNDLSEYYQYLAYQSYYNSMYGGYGGYGGYGYGGYGGYGYGNSYSNYYTYMMMAQMYSNTGTQDTTQKMLDKDRYYFGQLNGPGAEGRVPTLKLTFSVPNQE